MSEYPRLQTACVITGHSANTGAWQIIKNGVVLVDGLSKQDTERLVLCCNHHEALVAACRKQHQGLDRLLALCADKIPDFLPTESQAWPAILAGNTALQAVDREVAAH